MSRDFVFVGPSLPAAEVAGALPAATILPPIEHGDLLRLDAVAGDRVLMIDGLFLQSASVRHREITLLLDRGVTVAGSSSMGALRAAELWPFGMRGIGEVFRLYRDGVVTGDDEVAIVHGSAEDGYRPLSEPLVNIRVALDEATAAGVLTEAEARDVLELARRLPFRTRGYRALTQAGQGRPVQGAVDRFVAWAGRHATDTKAADARLMLALAARDDPRLRPPDGADRPIRNVHTRLLDAWHGHHAGQSVDDRYIGDARAIATVMLTHPGYPAAHRQQVLARVAGSAADDPSAEEQAVAVARARGLHGSTGPGPETWLGGAELALPEPERLRRLLVRGFGTSVYRQIDRRMLPPELATGAVLRAAAQFLVDAERINDRLPMVEGARPTRRMRFQTDVIERVFAGLWNCRPAELYGAVWDRGFADLDSFWLAAEPLVAYLKMVGPPEYPPPPAVA